MRDHHLDTALRDPDRHRRERESLDLQIAHHGELPRAFVTESIRNGNAHRIEDQLRRVGCAHAELVLALLAEPETIHPPFDHEGRNFFVAGRRVDHESIAKRIFVDAAVRDEHLSSVDHVRIPVQPRAGSHREHIGADLGFRHAQPTDPLTGHRERQDTLLQRVVAVDLDILGEENRVGEHRERKARV